MELSSAHSVFVVWERGEDTICNYLGNPLLPHPFHDCKGVVSCHVTPSAEVETKGPIWREIWSTNQLFKENTQYGIDEDLQYPGIEALTTISTYPYLSVLLDHLIRPWTKEEVEVQYPTNSAIRDGRVGLQLDLWGRGEIPWHVSVYGLKVVHSICNSVTVSEVCVLVNSSLLSMVHVCFFYHLPSDSNTYPHPLTPPHPLPLSPPPTYP